MESQDDQDYYDTDTMTSDINFSFPSNSTTNFTRHARRNFTVYVGFNTIKILHSSSIIFANALLLYFLITTSVKRRYLGNHFYFICNFSIVDFLVGIVNLLQSIVYVSYATRETVGTIDILFHAIFKMLIAASLFLFLSHAFVQWRAIRKPLTSRFLPIRGIFILTMSAWLMAGFMCGIGSWLKFRVKRKYNLNYQAYKYFELVVYLICTTLICLFYVLVLKKIRNKQKRGTSIVVPDKNSSISAMNRSICQEPVYAIGLPSLQINPNPTVTAIDQNGLRLNCNNSRGGPYNPRKATLTSLTVAAVHILCSIPYIVFYICYFTRDPNDPSAQLLKLYINGILLTLRSLLLPIIFMRRTPEIYARIRRACRFRRAIKPNRVGNSVNDQNSPQM